MTSLRSPRLEPGAGRFRMSDDPGGTAAGRVGRRMALIALVLSIAALGLAVWHAFAPADPGCQTTAWNATPAKQDLPTGWTLASSQYDIGRKSMSIVGPVPADSSASRAVVYATITCYPQGAADSVTRSADAATAAGQSVEARDDLGDQGFSATDTSGAVFLQFRHGNVVVYLAASGEANATEVDRLAAGFDRALGGDGGAALIPTPGAATPAGSGDAGSAAPSDEASPTVAAAPELEARLPSQVGTVALTIDSATGTMILGEDQGSRAIVAALRADGRQPDALKVAQAYDVNVVSDLAITAINVTGLTDAKLFRFVVDSWLSASGAGIKADTVTLAGRTFTRIDRGDGGALDYVIAEKSAVIVITTADAALAAQAAAALP